MTLFETEAKAQSVSYVFFIQLALLLRSKIAKQTPYTLPCKGVVANGNETKNSGKDTHTDKKGRETEGKGKGGKGGEDGWVQPNAA